MLSLLHHKVRSNPNAKLIRVNMEHPEGGRAEDTGRFIGIAGDAAGAIGAISEALASIDAGNA